MLAAAITANRIGQVGQTFDLKRVEFINLDLKADENGIFVVRVAPRSSRTGEPGRGDIKQDDSVAVMVIRRMASDQLTEAEQQTFVGECLLVMEQIENELLQKTNAYPWQLVLGATDGPWYQSATYHSKSNSEELIFNPEGLSQRRQFESRLVANYAAVRATE